MLSACWRFDRFARSVSHLLRALETFKALGSSSFLTLNKWTLRPQLGKWFLPC